MLVRRISWDLEISYTAANSSNVQKLSPGRMFRESEVDYIRALTHIWTLLMS
jgi:hypothetical protein